MSPTPYSNMRLGGRSILNDSDLIVALNAAKRAKYVETAKVPL